VAAEDCGYWQIRSQADADAVRQSCPNVISIVLTHDIPSSINLDGIQSIQLVLETDGDGSSAMTEVSSSTLTSIGDSLILKSQHQLRNISFPALQSVAGAFRLNDLPALESLSVANLSTIGGFHVENAPKLPSLNLDLRTFSSDGFDPNRYQIRLSNLSVETLKGLNAAGGSFEISLQDLPKLQRFEWAPTADSNGNIQISGVGPFDFAIYGPNTSNTSVSWSPVYTLNVTGLRSFTCNSGVVLQVQEGYFDGGSLAVLDLANLTFVETLSVTNNANLNQLRLPASFPAFNSFGDAVLGINISNNPLLSSDSITSSAGPWPWGIINAASMTFRGLFHTDFL